MKASLRKITITAALVFGAALSSVLAQAAEPGGAQLMRESRGYYSNGQYFRAARYAFAAGETDHSLSAVADAQITLSLVRANLDNAASYFFIRTLQSGNRDAIRTVLGETQTLLVHVGGDLLRKYLIRHTKYEDYDTSNRSAYLYSLGKDALLSGRTDQAVGYFTGISQSSPLWPFALQLRGSAQAILGRHEQAIQDFKRCQSEAGDYSAEAGLDHLRALRAEREAKDLEARCLAGEARTLYQMDRFDDADQVYDKIPKASLVWPDMLFEQAWNSFGRTEYNRTLGKLVSYKSPALGFVHNSEIDVLRAQSYLALCLYEDANQVINEFNAKYAPMGEGVKAFVETNAGDPTAFYRLGKEALHASLYAQKPLYRMANRFVRGPYFQNLVASERELIRESTAIRQFASMQAGTEKTSGRGFPGFLDEVLGWRAKTIRMLGGAFVKNSFMDYHSALISDFEKMSFIKLEMLKEAKESLIYKNSTRKSSSERMRGNVQPERRDYQYYWGFNGEFWNDELGDYVFGLESECRSKQ